MNEPRGTVREEAAERLERDAVLIGCACHEGPEDMTIHGGGLGRECPVCLLAKSHRALRLREPEGRDGWGPQRGILIYPADREGDPVSFHATEDQVVKVGWCDDGTLWVITEPFREWTMAPGADSWTTDADHPESNPVASPSPTDTRG